MQAKYTSRVRGHLYRGYLDYQGALAELEIARQTLPNDARLFELKGYIERRRPGGNQEEALRNLERAIDLDPRNVLLLQQTALSLRRSSALSPTKKQSWTACWPYSQMTSRRKASRAFVELDWKADTRPLHQFIDSIRATNPGAIRRYRR